MTNPVMLVTGGSRGIGAATARLAAERGWDVVVNFVRDADAAAEVADACQATGQKAVACQADVSDEAQVIALFETVVNELGVPTAIVNNAGVISPVGRFEDYTVERIRHVVDANIVGAMLVAREAVRLLSTDRGGPGGSIVNVSSAASYLGSPNEFIDYAATKGAMDTWTMGLAKEVATEGIRVNAVRPGLIETEIHAAAGAADRLERLVSGVPMHRTGTAAEVAETILWLASAEASYVTGSLVNVSGGR